MKIVTVAIVGCGSRGQDTYAQILAKMPERAKIVAVADIDPEKLEGMRKLCGLPQSRCYASAEELLYENRLADAVLICTPDRLHYRHAKAALQLDYNLLLEKPISPNADECRELSDLARKHNRHVIVCHVLRYTPFYQKTKELIESGILGEVVSLQAIELVGYWHQAHSFVRGNWCNTEQSSPMILQKCCHDMDILLWLTGKHCRKVTSFGSLTHFTKEKAPKGAPMRCTDGCPVAQTCAFNAVNFYLERLRKGDKDWPVNVVAFDPTEDSIMKALREGPYGRCVYHCDNDVVDHQVVNLELENGVTVNFTMCAFTAHGGRTLRVMGTRGELLCDMKKETVLVMPFGQEDKEIDITKLTDDFSGHGGGDARMMDEFISLIAGEETKSTTLSSIERSVESHLVALAAEASRLAGGSLIEMESMKD